MPLLKGLTDDRVKETTLLAGMDPHCKAPPDSRGSSRADAALTAFGLASSRTEARKLILAGLALCNGQVIDKASRKIAPHEQLSLKQPLSYVSRAAEKLAAVLDAVPLQLKGIEALDVGASTGGFTDCLLQRGVEHVTCVDVGHGQLHPKLQKDPRVCSIEGLNARHLRAEQLPQPLYPLIVVDVSFISLTLVLPALWPLLATGGHLISLVKPQFELGQAAANRGQGIIRDKQAQLKALEGIKSWWLAHSGSVECIDERISPIRGSGGNQEFLLTVRRSKSS
jgi:23S rRNA (cytidine1920-2'-O)/16S rRNA (cytidine1409-2'-O)-methyltransferase